MAQLNIALCGGTEETNTIYWASYCEGPQIWRELLTGVVPSLVLSLYQNMLLPNTLYGLTQVRAVGVHLYGVRY
jgi:hypothetical protein